MNQLRLYGPVIAVGAGVLLFYVLSAGTSKPPSEVGIYFTGNSNSLRGPVALLWLSNEGNTTVRLDPYCALYWTNRVGVETNMFFEHDLAGAILHPAQSNLVAVPHPPDARVWDMSFSYATRPSAVNRAWNRIRFLLPGSGVLADSLTCRLGPCITNPTFGSESAISPKQ